MFLQSFLSYNVDVKDTYLAAEGYYPENKDEVTITDIPAEIQSRSLRKRKELILNGKKVFFNTRIAVYLFDTDRFLPPNVDIKIKLVRSAEKFGLLLLYRNVPTSGSFEPNVGTFLLKTFSKHLKTG